MASTLPPVRGVTYNFPISLVSQGDTDIFQVGATITTADVWVSKDGGAFAAVTAAPTELLTTPGGANTGVLWQNLTATEMAADLVTVLYHDASGSQWQDALVFISTGAQTLDTTDGIADDIKATVNHTDYGNAKLVRATTPANTLDIEATGVASANVTCVAGQSELVDNLVLALGTGGLVEKLNSMLEAAGLAYRFTAEALAEAPSGSGLTAQEAANAVHNLAPVGTPAAGSIGDHLDDLATALAAATANVTVVSAVDGGEINIYQAVTLSATISGLAIPAGWTKVYWTVKRATSEADTDAILQMVETNPSAGTDGLLRVNGAAGTAGNGSLTVDQAAGTVVIDLLMTICDDLALATGLVWSLKALHPTSAATLLATGTVNVLGQATMAVA